MFFDDEERPHDALAEMIIELGKYDPSTYRYLYLLVARLLELHRPRSRADELDLFFATLRTKLNES